MVPVLATICAIAASASSSHPVDVRHERLKLPTYPIYFSDINPKFYEIEGSILYPYTMQDDLGDIREERTYRTFVLENEYLKVICLPQIGGRIHSVLDKTTNQEMFHRNDVIKPGLIAMRGAWISGGIEWNRGPQGHTVTSFSPCTVYHQTHPDGSASLIIADTESMFRTRWWVKLTLHPGKAYLHETIRIQNPTDGTHSYYFWNNTAFPCKPGTRFIYPMTLGQDHAGTSFFSWPIHNGNDITWLKNYDEPSSVFAYQCAFDFFGAYDVDDNRGIVQFGEHRILTGKKAWTWGQSGDGIASQRALHDDDSQYIEVQSGPLQTQADYGLLEPRQQIAWEEWWYPVHGLGDGFEYATKELAVQTSRSDADGGTLEVRMIATANYPQAVCSVRALDGRTAAATIETVNLSPIDPAIIRVPAPGGTPVHIDVRTADGGQLVSYTSPLDIPKREPPQPAAANASPSVEELYFQGVKHEERIEPGPARAAYAKAIEADPGFTDALVALARIEYCRANYSAALDYAGRALQRDPNCGMAWYYTGLASMELPADRRKHDPLDVSYKVVTTLDHSALGHDLGGRILMRQKRYSEAVQKFRLAVAQNPVDSVARDHLIAALHADGQTEAVTLEALQQLNQDTLDLVARAILGLQRKSDLYEFGEFMRQYSGRYDGEMMQIAFFLTDLGLYADAYRVYTEAYSEPVPNATGVLYHGSFPDLRDRPMPWYMLAWLAHKVQEDAKSREYLAKAKSIIPHYQFPSRPEQLEVMRYAVETDPEDANAHLMLGNLLAHFGRVDDAVKHWELSASLPNACSVAFRNLAMHAWKKENNLKKSADLFQKAIASFPGDQTLFRDAADALIADNRRPEAIRLLEEMPLDHPRRGDITVILARAYNDEKRYDDTIALLASSTLSNWELNTESWEEFHRAHVERGKLRYEAKDFAAALEDFETSLTYPESLGVGRAARPREAQGWYWKGMALAALGRKDEARAAWTEGASGLESTERQKEYIAKCKEALAG